MITAVLRILLFWGIHAVFNKNESEKVFGFLAGTCLALVFVGLWMSDSPRPQIGHLFSAIAYGTYVVIGVIREFLPVFASRLAQDLGAKPEKSRFEEILRPD